MQIKIGMRVHGACLDWGCGNEEDRQRSLENQDRACASLLLRIRSPASNPGATATRARLNMLPPIGFSNHRPILMQWSIVQIVNVPGATGTGIVCNPATEGWLAGPETLIEIARIQRWKDSEKANCF